MQSNGYELQQDGKYYKYYSDNLVFKQAQLACFNDKANVAAGYPALENQMFLNLTPSDEVLPAGAYLITDVATGKWVTFDGQSIQVWFLIKHYFHLLMNNVR